MTDQATYQAAAHRAEILRRASTGPLTDYLAGYRQGMWSTRGEVAPGTWQSPADETGPDLSRAARALGLADGRTWDTGHRSGLIRLAARVLGVSHRVLAEQHLTRDERTIRRWLSGEIVPPAVAVNALYQICQPSAP